MRIAVGAVWKMLTPSRCAIRHGRLAMVLVTIAAPHQHLVDGLAFLRRRVDGLVDLLLVVDEVAAAVVAVHGDEHAAAGVGDALPAGHATESAEDDGVRHAEARA